MWASCGFAHLIVDNRGSGGRGSRGWTPDPAAGVGPEYPGFLTRGLSNPETFYYRRVLTDAALALDAATQLDTIDPTRIGVFGLSQGGAMALAAAGLNPVARAVHAKAPFLADFRRAVQVVDTSPSQEITGYLAIHHGEEEQVFTTLSYADVVNFAARLTIPGLIAVALSDTIVPPSTVFAVYHAYRGPKNLRVWEFNGHEAGGPDDDADGLAFFATHLGSSSDCPLDPPASPTKDVTSS
jgi:cephalosporin-C deacetylase